MNLHRQGSSAGALDAFLGSLGTLERRGYQLGRMRLDLGSNCMSRLAGCIHPLHLTDAPAAPDWRAVFVEMPLDRVPGEVQGCRSRSYRGNRLFSGHYLGHHFGRPALLVESGKRDLVCIGEEPDRIFWTFFLKYAVTLHHLDLGILHLKAATIVRNDRAFLLLGRGGAGKSTLAFALCRRGASLMSNTHCLVDSGVAQGLATAVRVRDSRGERALPPAEAGIPWESRPKKIAGLIFLQGPSTRTSIERLPPPLAVAFAQEFAGAINNYDLKEDVADYCGSLTEAAKLFRAETELLRGLVETQPSFRVEVDPGDDRHLADLETLLDGLSGL